MPDPANSSTRPDQATTLRSLAAGRRRSTLSVAILSGKGGVGKSNIAVNVSLCLAERGLRVTLVDLDMGLANADLLMDLHPRYTLAHVIGGLRSIEEILIRGPGGIRFVPGASGLHGLANLSEFERHNLIAQLHRLHPSTDIAVYDLGAGLSRNVLSFAHAVQQVWVVTTPEPTAVTDAYATVKALYREHCRAAVRLLVNMAESRTQAQAVYRRIAGVAKKFLDYSVADGGYVLHDTAVEAAVQARCPVVIRSPGSNASACLAAIAGDVARQCAVPELRAGFLQRVAALFV